MIQQWERENQRNISSIYLQKIHQYSQNSAFCIEKESLYNIVYFIQGNPYELDFYLYLQKLHCDKLEEGW